MSGPKNPYDSLGASDAMHQERMGVLPELMGGMEVTSRKKAGIGTVIGGYPEGRIMAPKAPLKFLSYDDMINLADPKWLIDGVIMDETSALLFGKSNSFKSFLAIDMACHIALGCGSDSPFGSERTHWHGQKLGCGWRALYVATEGGLGVAKQRIPGWMEHHEIAKSERGCVFLYPQEIALDDDKAVNDLLRTCAITSAIENGEDTWSDPERAFNIVVIDIFGASMMGPETSDETARAWVRNVNRIQREMRCAVLTVAHTGWADDTRARMHTHFGDRSTPGSRPRATRTAAPWCCGWIATRTRTAVGNGAFGWRL